MKDLSNLLAIARSTIITVYRANAIAKRNRGDKKEAKETRTARHSRPNAREDTGDRRGEPRGSFSQKQGKKEKVPKKQFIRAQEPKDIYS